MGDTPAAPSARDGEVSRTLLRAPRPGTRAGQLRTPRMGTRAGGWQEPRRALRRPGCPPRPLPGHRGAGRGVRETVCIMGHWRHAVKGRGALEAGKRNTALRPSMQAFSALGRPSPAVSHPGHEERGTRGRATEEASWWRLHGRGALKIAVPGPLAGAGCLESASFQQPAAV